MRQKKHYRYWPRFDRLYEVDLEAPSVHLRVVAHMQEVSQKVCLILSGTADTTPASSHPLTWPMSANNAE